MHKQSTQFDPSQYISKNTTKIRKVAHKRPQSNDTYEESMCHSSFRFILIFQVYLYRHV